jgi:hypothetical protein
MLGTINVMKRSNFLNSYSVDIKVVNGSPKVGS